MIQKLYCDLETFSPIPLKNGTHAYAEQSEVMLWTWAADEGKARCWDRTTGARMPSELEDGLADERAMTVWQNGGMFDRVVLKHAMPDIYTQVPIERWYDTRVQALAHSLPGGLDALCEIFKVADEDKKLATGKQLIQLFCVPPAKNLKRPRATRITHPEQWEQFKLYAIQDIPSMRAVHKKMPTWNYRGGELALWQLDQAINMRGMCMDVDLAHAALRAVDREQKALAARTVDLTDGAVQKATQRDQLLRYLVTHYTGLDLPDMKKSTLERRIEDPDLPWALRELLSIRLQASTTSTSKYKTLLRGVSADGRLRGTKQFNGASRTGRWAGRLFQPDNMPRPNMKQPEIEFAIAALKADCDDLVLPDVMRATSNAIRGCIVAPPGKKLVVADLSNIEGRVLAWLAGEEWKLQAFRDYDTILDHDTNGKPIRAGHDLYKLAYSKSFGIAPEAVDDDQRQVGKVQELALGYEGGVGAFLTFAAAYRLDLEAMGAQAVDMIPADIWDEARGMLKWTKQKRRSTFGLSDQAWMVCESFKRSWRAAHPATVALWKNLAAAIKLAIARPQQDFPVMRLTVRREGAWLRIRLPSGRFLCYPSPRVDDSGQISYMGVHQYSRKWTRINSYSGKFVENCTQAVARDIMAHNMRALDVDGDLNPVGGDGYAIVLTVHDEVICEAPDTPDWNPEHLAGLLSENPPWALDLPLAAAGFESKRYKKG